MAVHEVVPAGRVRRFLAEHLERELAELAGEVGLVEIFERPGHDVPDQHPGFDLDDRWQVARRRAGEYVDLDAARREALGDFDDVDVHAAGVAGSWLL
jgi:hypothetical protein